MNFDFIIDDWKKIPQTTKYIFAFGAFLIFLVWLVDHWGAKEVYRFFGFDFRNLFFSTGVLVVLLTFIPLIWKQWVYWSRAQSFRHKYPLNNLNTTFHLFWLHGRLYLFDVEEKKYFHIHPWETAQDLLFSDLGVRLPFTIHDLPSVLTLKNGEIITIAAYVDGGVINTRT